MTSGNGLTVTYTASNKTATITRGTTSISFDHDPEHQRYSQLSASGLTLYIGGGGVLAERFVGSGSTVQWTNYLFAAGQMVGVFVERSDETVATRYFHLDHLGSVSVITDENGVVVERLSYDAWGVRRHPDGTPDPAHAITSQSTRGFTGHEQLDSVGLIHMNGRVYDPLLARFGTPDPMTENPFSTQGWNRYSYVGNSPVNFTDPSGYCFLGCFWKPIFKAIQRVLQRIPILGSIIQIAAAVICAPAGLSAVCASAAGAVVTGITSGNLGMALRAGLTAFVTASAFTAIGNATAHGTLDFMSPVPLDVRLHIGRRHKACGVTKPLQLARPMMRSCVRLNPDQARRQLLEEWQHLSALQLPPNDDGAPSINAVDLEHRLGNV